MRGIHGRPGWSWLFLIEGAITAVIGILTAFYLPGSPTQTKGYLRGKNGWFNEREEVIMVSGSCPRYSIRVSHRQGFCCSPSDDRS